MISVYVYKGIHFEGKGPLKNKTQTAVINIINLRIFI